MTDLVYSFEEAGEEGWRPVVGGEIPGTSPDASQADLDCYWS